MDTTTQERHRPGALKQQNKSHKTGNHRSKGVIHKLQKGKVNTKSITRKCRRELRKEDRRNQAVQLRKKKRDEVLTKKRSLGGTNNSPFLVAVVPICEDVDPLGAIELLKQADVEATVKTTTQGNVHIAVPRFKQRFCLTTPRVGDLYAVLDVLKVADFVLFLTSVSVGESESLGDVGDAIMTAALAQRLPTPIIAVVDLETVPIKKRNECKQAIQDTVSRWLPGEKVASLGSTLEAMAMLRRVGGQKRRSIAQRDKRAHLVAEHVEMAVDNTADGTGTLKVEGFVRGQALSPDCLIHVPGFGQYQVERIQVLADPTVGGFGDVLEEMTPNPVKQESLVCENDVDPMDAEQTWPTAEDHSEAEGARGGKGRKIRVPKGMSDYQAAWIPDDLRVDAEDDEESDDDDDESESGAAPEAMEAESDSDSAAPASESVAGDDDDAADGVLDGDRYDDKIDLEEEQAALRRKKAAAAAGEDVAFPDEVDTPADTPARVRFQKYRGLQSFRTSTWDPAENLPPDYARIFQFESYDRMRRRVFKTEEEVGGAAPGRYVRVHLSRVPLAVFSAWRAGCSPLVLCAMLPHEQKMSVLNVVVRNSSSQPIAGKQELVFHVGYRRFKARPIFSQHTSANKHKYERYWQPGATVVASVYAPVMFSPATVLVFLENKDGDQDLVGTGDVLNANPSRIVTKRVVLSGHPFKVLKRSAVVRFMFFNREDIVWFKPVELTTRYGRRGHIREPLGTHGHMKCVFDTQLKSQDVVFMRLYKRVFPPWSFEDLTGSPPPLC